MKVFKKSIGVLISVAMLLSISDVALAAGDSTTPVLKRINENSFMVGNMLYEEAKTDDGQYILTSSVDGQLVDRVTIQQGKDEFLYERLGGAFAGPSSAKSSTQASATQVLHLSDYVRYNPAGYSPIMPLAYTIRTGNLGTVLYQAYEGGNFVYHLLSFYSTLVYASSGQYTVNGDVGDAWTIVIAALSAALGGVFAGLAAKIIIMAGGAAAGTLKSKFTTYVDGSAYYYNVTANTNDGTGRSSIHGGAEYYGTIQSNSGIYLTNQTVYDGYYPSFIIQRDTMVASWFFQDFWSTSIYSVYSW